MIETHGVGPLKSPRPAVQITSRARSEGAQPGHTGGVSREPQTVVVTGASAGVGRATARAFAARGAQVALIARGHEGLEAARRDVEAAGGRALVVPADVADAAAIEAAATTIDEQLGPIDVWVN